MKNDILIAQEARLENMDKIARKAKIQNDYLEYYGKDKAKINLSLFDKVVDNKDGKLILVTAINPTKAGEGKSTTTIGLVDGLAKLNKNVIGALREPSLGPVFGLKGGATGGGYAQVMPMEDINLHFTGDMHAITTANNLISATIDNSIFQGNSLNIDPNKVVWKRCMDMNDRSLRDITIAQGEKNGIERKDGFNITVASEIMAIFCLAKSLSDFKSKVENVVVAYTYDNSIITVKDLNISGALELLMKEAIKPNLVQTLENNPVIIHGGPFANIAHGCNSVIATKLALKLADFVVTEAGFGADLGAEKFMNIKCRNAEISPSAVVIVVTVRALKLHGGVAYEDLQNENMDAVTKGIVNLEKHIDSIKSFNVPYVVTINQFLSDTQKELNTIIDWCKNRNHEVVLCEGWAKGGEGATDLANAVIHKCEEKNEITFTYDLTDSIETKIYKIATKIYGGSNIELSDKAKEQIQEYNRMGWNILPICMAKTPLSLSDNPKLVGRPTDFTIHVKELRISAGAGFIVVLTGSIMTMPGLPKNPAATLMGIDEKGNSYGIF